MNSSGLLGIIQSGSASGQIKGQSGQNSAAGHVQAGPKSVVGSSRSGLKPASGHGGQSNRIGVILGTIQGERQTKNILRVRKGLLAEIIEKSGVLSPDIAKEISSGLVEIIRQRIPENNEDTTPGLLSNIISGRIANHFGLNGVNYVVDASCASSVIAIKNAIRGIASKQLDFVLAGGVDANLYPAVLMAFKRLGLLSGTEPRFFDSRSDGYAMSEGAAIHLVTTYRKAKESGMEILAQLSDCCVKSSAPDHLLAPSEQTFVSTINACYIKNGVRKRDIGYLDLFAFSNIMGDMVEKQVVEKCFEHAKIVSHVDSSSYRSDTPGSQEKPSRQSESDKQERPDKLTPLYFGNIKDQFGYFKAANPAVALAKIVLMNKKRALLPNFGYDPKFSSLKNPLVPGIEYDAPTRFAFNVNGIGGNHCHMIVSALPPYLHPVKESTAVSDDSCSELTNTTKNSLPTGTTENESLATSALSRDFEMKQKNQTTIALLSGQGAQSPGMMKDLFESDPNI
ncbi:MAG: hypothetical protein HQK61_12380, partial [Desulfamplus sp.]|nr:hypothetical protein [Desulfamplus sp.]